MDRFVPLDKKSKKEQKKFHARQRKTWEGISPVTRTVPNGKAYNRKKLKADERRSSSDFRNEKLLFCYFRANRTFYSLRTSRYDAFRREAKAMFKRKKNRVYLELTHEEKRNLLHIMIWFRNKVLARGGPTEDIDGVILKLAK